MYILQFNNNNKKYISKPHYTAHLQWLLHCSISQIRVEGGGEGVEWGVIREHYSILVQGTGVEGAGGVIREHYSILAQKQT